MRDNMQLQDMETTQRLHKDAIAQASAAIIQRLGLPPRKQDWSYEQRFQYNKELASYINTYPYNFSPEMRTLALNVQQQDFSPLEDTSFKWGDFVDNFVGEVAKQNPLSPQNFNKSLAIVASIAVAGLVIYGIIKNGKS